MAVNSDYWAMGVHIETRVGNSIISGPAESAQAFYPICCVYKIVHNPN